MKLEKIDYNGAGDILDGNDDWKKACAVLEAMPLHLKGSDQSGKQGSLIFDPVGTNAYIKSALGPLGWEATKIAPEYAFLGLDVDFARKGIVLEAQFSNYPFLLNNLLRSELFYREKVSFAGAAVSVTVIVVKAGMFPASNSTLYYEQALNQLNGLAKFNIFSVPLRLVGLFSPIQRGVTATYTSYASLRYSRTVAQSEAIEVNISKGFADRCKIVRA